MNLIKQHRVLTAVAAILVLLTLIIWVAQDNEQGPLIEPEELVTQTIQAQADAKLVYEAEILADYTLPDRHLSYGQTQILSAETSVLPTATLAVAQPEQDQAVKQDMKLSEIRPPRATVERDEAGHPQENRPLDLFRTDDSTVYIRAFQANIRSSPRTDGDLVTKLEMGDKLLRTAYGNYWSAVTTAGGLQGYVLTELISQERIHKIIPTPTPTPKPTAAPKATSTKTTAATEPASVAEPTPAAQAETAATSSEAKPTASPQKEAHSDEFMLFARVVAMEGNGQYESYLAVASVIMNHVSHKSYPNSITAVLSRPGAFSVYRKAASGQPAKVNSAAMKAASDAYYNGARNLPSYVIAFSTPAAYERNVANKGSFSKMAVYQRAYNAVWCYNPADKR